MPLLPDKYGRTALDQTLGIYSNPDPNIFKEVTLDSDEIAIENVAMAEVIFDGIKEYSFMHSSYFITEAVIKAASMGLKSFMDYFDLRLKSVEHAFTSKTEHGINKKST